MYEQFSHQTSGVSLPSSCCSFHAHVQMLFSVLNPPLCSWVLQAACLTHRSAQRFAKVWDVCREAVSISGAASSVQVCGDVSVHLERAAGCHGDYKHWVHQVCLLLSATDVLFQTLKSPPTSDFVKTSTLVLCFHIYLAPWSLLVQLVWKQGVKLWCRLIDHVILSHYTDR